MAQIHPNDIGLATFADVGNVERLRTTAKTVVEAINELYMTGSTGSTINGNQLYVDGEDNIIIGMGNTVYGSNNLIIGSDNTVIGNNVNLIGNNKNIAKSVNLYPMYFDNDGTRIYVEYYDYETGTQLSLPFNVGDKIIVSLTQNWVDTDWTDLTSVSTGKKLCEITEIGSGYIIVSGISISTSPPDEIHTNMDYPSVDTFIPLSDEYSYEGNKSAILMGSEAIGNNSVSFGFGHATGATSFAANSSTASGNYSAALCSGKSTGSYAFSVNQGQAYAANSSALNNSYNYAPYSLGTGYYSRLFGRALKCESLNVSTKKLTVQSGQTISDLVGKTIVIRCYNKNNSWLYKEAVVESISGNVLQLKNVNFNTSASYAETLFPDSYAFVIDSSTTHSQGEFAGGGYSIASGKYAMVYGYHVLSAAEGAITFGKFGNNSESYALGLANGSSLKAPGMAFLVHANGDVSADGEYTSPCADYAEFFEWTDGNPEAEDRVGYFVKLSGDKIVKCGEFDTPLGIVSATPAIVGDSSELHWQGKFITDDFGRVQYHDVVVPAELDEDGNVITEEHIESQPILNPDWDANTKYVPRKERPEWSTVGVLGKLVVYDDGSLKSGDICRCGADGKAVKSIENGYAVLKRVSDDKVLIWFRG